MTDRVEKLEKAAKDNPGIQQCLEEAELLLKLQE